MFGLNGCVQPVLSTPHKGHSSKMVTVKHESSYKIGVRVVVIPARVTIKTTTEDRDFATQCENNSKDGGQ